MIDSPLSESQIPVNQPPAPAIEKLLMLSTFVVIVAALYVAKEVLVPITLAVLLSFVLAPVVRVLHKFRIPNALAVIVAALMALSAMGALGSIIGLQIAGLATDVPKYASTVETKVSNLQSMALATVSRVTSTVGHDIRHPVQNSLPSAIPAPLAPGAPKPVPVVVEKPLANPSAIAKNVLAPVLAPIESAFIVFIVAVFILMQKEDLRDRVIRLFGTDNPERTTRAMDDAGRRLSRYFLCQLCINTVFGTTIGIGLAFIGVPSPLLWGILGGMLRFVPYIGPIIAAIAPTALAAAVDPHWSMVFWTLGLFAVTEGVTGQVVEPLVYGHSTGVSPLAVVIAAIFWSWIWGPIGLILSTPLTLCLVVLGRHVKKLAFLDILLGDGEKSYQHQTSPGPV